MSTVMELLDPRGAALDAPASPARRLPALEGRTILLVDNGKLGAQYGSYGVIADELRAGLSGARWRVHAQDLLRLVDHEVEALAEALAGDAPPDAAVLALADAGVSLQTGLLAVALERRGVPTVVVATPLGAGLLQAIFDAAVPGLTPVVLETIRTDTQEQLSGLMAAVLGEVRDRLTSEQRRPDRAAASRALAVDGERWSFAAEHALEEFQDVAESLGLGDGLPLLPPTRRAVEALLAAVPDDPDEVIYGPAPTSRRSLRVRDVAANAAMTACPPRAFPVVLAALRAMAHRDYRLSQAAITTHPAGNAIVFSGPNAGAYGLASGAGCLGPGNRANATVGRAVTLSVISLFGARPGGADLTAFGSPAEFTYCLAENVEESPWSSLGSELGDGGPGVFVAKMEAPRNVLEHLATTPEGICEALADTATSIGSNNAYVPGDLLLLVNPEHAQIFHHAGWTREDLALAVYQRARNPRSRLEGHGVGPIRPSYMASLEEFPVARSPRDIHVVVAGGRGPQSMVALPWGYARGQWQPIAAREARP